jgi:hypothetical protein
MKASAAALLLLVVAACGQAQARPEASVAPITSTTSAGLLLAVLQSHGTATSTRYDMVAITGLDGHIVASATFAPMPQPATACMGAILQPSAHAAAGQVFYADAKGVVRSLAINGAVTAVTAFPMASNQQMLSFAVSPDGTQLLGTVFTVPTNAWPCDGSASNANYTFDTYTATSGNPSSLVSHQTWSKPQNALAVTGWDAVGPIGTYPTVWASQGGGPGSTLGVLVRVDAATGKPLAPFSDPSTCLVWDSVPSGAFVCTGDSVMTGGGTAQQKVAEPVSVRGPNGMELWHFTATGQNAPFRPLLAPDGQHAMICCNDLDLANAYEVLVGSGGAQVNLAKGFGAYGWLDSTRMVGSFNTDPLNQGPVLLAVVAADAPGIASSLGISGNFVGTVRG